MDSVPKVLALPRGGKGNSLCFEIICFLVLKFSIATEGPQSPFHHILPKCKLARDLKETYDR